MNPNRKRIVEITTMGLFIAIIFVMTFVPNIGYIQVRWIRSWIDLGCHELVESVDIRCFSFGKSPLP
jgi:hypothetical protein